MAIVKMSGIGITELSGKFGGTVGARGKSGMTVRNRVKPTNPKTDTQTAQRARMSNISSNWRTLTDAERKAWNQAAASGEWPTQNRLGETVSQSGFGLYGRLNNTLVLAYSIVISMPPLKVAFSAVDLVDLYIDTGTNLFRVQKNDAITGNETILYFASAGVSAGVGHVPSKRLVEVNPSVNNVDIFTSYVNVFGVPTVGSRVFVSLAIVNIITGQRAVVGQLSAIVI